MPAPCGSPRRRLPEDAEELRGHAATFIAGRFPQPAGPDPSSIAGRAEYDEARETLGGAYARETAAAHGAWSEAARDRARAAGAPEPGEVDAEARLERAESEADMTAREAGREARAGMTERASARAARASPRRSERPFGEHAANEVPFIGGWLGARLYGTAGNASPDGGGRPAGGPEDEGPEHEMEAGGGTEIEGGGDPAADRGRRRRGS